MSEVTPSKAQYFYAQPWLINAWLAAVPLLFVAAAIRAAGISFVSIRDWSVVLSLAVMVPLAGMLGFFVAILIGWFIFGPLYYDRSLKNGAPFVAGDHVRILVGRHRDRIVRVYDVWETREQVRVDLGEEERNDVTDVFSYYQVCREAVRQCEW